MNHGRISRVAALFLIGVGVFLLWQNVKSPSTRPPVWTEGNGTTTGGGHQQTAHRRIRAKRGDAPPVAAQTPQRMKVYHSSKLAPAWAVRFGGEFWRRPSLNDDNAAKVDDGSV